MSGLIKDLKKFNRLARIANSTLGSNGPGNKPYAAASTEHIRFEMINEKTIKVHYQGAIAIPSKSMMSSIMFKLIQDALNGIKRAMEKFAKDYKEEFESTLTLKLNENTIIDSVEFTSYSTFRPTQSGMLRVTALIDVDGGDDVERYFDKVEKKENIYKPVKVVNDDRKKNVTATKQEKLKK